MRIHPFFLTLIASLATAVAKPTPTEAGKTQDEPTPRETALEHLLSERKSPAALDAAIADARKTGVSEQKILEARFLYQVDRRDDVALVGLLPDLIKQRENFSLADSAIFSAKEDWLAIIEYVQAIAALRKGDKSAFKNHITEAFWLSPNQAPVFAPHIDRLRLDEAMLAVKIDFSMRLTPLAPDADPLTLGKIISGKKALLLHFWSPMSEECLAALPDFAATSAALSKCGIAVVSLVPDDSAQSLTESRAQLRALGDKKRQALWLLDSKENPLARALRVRNLPTMVLISTDGKILFNGEPGDDVFWQTLKKIDAHIERPDAEKKPSE